MDARTLSLLAIAATLGFVSTPGLAKPADGEDQRSSRHARIVERFDTNGDGVIDDSEKPAIRKARKERRGKRHGQRHQRILKQFDTNGDGQLDEQERAAARESRRAKMLKHFDANGDGVLDRDERKTARKARRHRNRGHRQDRQHRQRRAVPGTEA